MQARTILTTMALIAFIGTAPPAYAHGDGPTNVTVSDYAYDPAFMEIEAGGTVIWTNVGFVPHEVSIHLHNPSHDAGPHMIPTGFSTANPTMGPFEPFTMVMLEAEDDPATPWDERVFEFTFDEPGTYVVNCNLGGDHDQMRQVIVVL